MSDKQVNSLLSNLRGEQYRRDRNAKRAPARSSPSLTQHISNLPPGILNTDSYIPPPPPPRPTRPVRPIAGPKPPKSWVKSLSVAEDIDSSEWRKKAISLVGPYMIPPFEPDVSMRLTALCLRVLREAFLPSAAEAFADEILPYVPPHLCRDFVRDCAVHGPLDDLILERLAEHGHIDGELVVVGPRAGLQQTRRLWKSVTETHDSWESAEAATSAQALNHLVLVSVKLPPPPLELPPSLVCLALVNVSDIPHIPSRLVTLCPLLEVLDLSYNKWLTTDRLEKVAWSRWSLLRVLGLRGCQVSKAVSESVNRGRWDDVEIIMD